MGGFLISEEESSLSPSNCSRAIDGDANFFFRCVLGFKSVPKRRPCALHHKFTATEIILRGTNDDYTLRDWQQEIQGGVSYPKILQ